MRFVSILCCASLVAAEEDATYLLQSQVLRASVASHQEDGSNWTNCGGSVGDNNAGATISGGNPASGVGSSCQCKAACDARSDCAGWTFTANCPGFTANGCFLRGQWGRVVRNCGSGYCEGAKKTVTSCGGAVGDNNAGATISGGNPASGVGSSCQCKAACDARSDCVGWTFTAGCPGFTANGCFLRGQWGGVVRNCGSGYCESEKKTVTSCGGAVGDNNAGATISGGNPASGVGSSCQCKAACDARSDCAGWTFTAGCPGFTANGCFLRGQWGGVVRNCGSGYCESEKKTQNACGGVVGDNNAGATISGGNPASGVGSSCECKAACDARSDCAGWTFTAGCPGFTANGCFLRGQWGGVVRNCRSGFCASAKKELQTPVGQCSGATPKCAGVTCVDGNWVCGGCSGGPPKCAGVACVNGNWACGWHTIGGCSVAQPKCAGVACVDGTWVCNWHKTPPGVCSGRQPKCGGIACVDGVWTCGHTEPGGTDSPGGDTEVTDADCFDAETGFGPGFSCANTEMFCGADSGDGLTVGECCPTKCKKEFENKKKKGRSENQRKNDLERKTKRNADEAKRKKAENARKKAHKDKEWNNKRNLKENKNKNEESERKNKRGLKENKRKNEQNWKKNKRARREAANKRSEKRNKNSPTPPAPKPQKPPSKKCKRKLKNWAKCAARAKCEKGQKKKKKKAPKC